MKYQDESHSQTSCEGWSLEPSSKECDGGYVVREICGPVYTPLGIVDARYYDQWHDTPSRRMCQTTLTFIYMGRKHYRTIFDHTFAGTKGLARAAHRFAKDVVVKKRKGRAETTPAL